MKKKNEAVEAEEYVIGASVQNDDIFRKMKARGCKDAWYTTIACRDIWNCMDHLDNQNAPIELGSVSGAIARLNGKTSVEDLERCYGAAVTVAHAAYYFELLRDAYIERTLDSLFKDWAAMDYDLAPSETISECIHQLQTLLPQDDVGKDVKDIVRKRAAQYRTAIEVGSIGIPSRWSNVQHYLCGYVRGKSHIIAGKSSQGKTMFLCNELLHAAEQGYKVGLVSMEMKEGEIRSRMAGDSLGLDLHKFEGGEAPASDIDDLEKKMIEQSMLPISISDGPHTIRDIRNWMMSHSDLDMLGIDYIQLIRQHSSDPKAIVERIGYYSNELANLASLCDIALLPLSQLSREDQFDRKGKPLEPKITHLKGSGSLEQDAEKIIFVYQDVKCGTEIFPNRAPTMVNIAKHRGGKIGKCFMTFVKSEQKFIPRRVD